MKHEFGQAGCWSPAGRGGIGPPSRGAAQKTSSALTYPAGSDPRERVVSVAYYALVKPGAVAAATDTAEAKWFPVSELPALAFDPAEILATALDRIRGKLAYQPIGFELLPPKFTLTQLQRLYEAALGRPLDKRKFRKKTLGYDLLIPLKETHQDGVHRPAPLFRFNPAKYERLKRKGFLFEL